MLRRGSNAVDAAVAAAVALTVVQPGSNDIGGDLFAIVWDGQRLHGLNASGRAPAGLTREAVLLAGAAAPTVAHGGAQARAGQAVPAYGWAPVTVPGAPAGWRDLHARFGSLPFADLFTDAIGYAERGYPVSPHVARGWRAALERHAALTGPEFAEWGRVFGASGPPAPGERRRNPTPPGRCADRRQRCGGVLPRADRPGHRGARGGDRWLLTAADLAGHTRPGSRSRSATAHECGLPPNGQGIAALLALAILDGLDLVDATEEERRHAQIEAMKLGFADTHAYVADPAIVPVPTADLLRPEYVASRRAQIGPQASDPAPGELIRGGTVYLCTADADGMMVSLIQSNYIGFGRSWWCRASGSGCRTGAPGSLTRLTPARWPRQAPVPPSSPAF